MKQQSEKAENRRKKEQRVVEEMILLYCKKNHRKKEGVCEECARLLEYAKLRSQNCPFMETKTFCSNCKVHCYSPKMREEIRKVMRFSGPRMLFHRPGMAIWHVVCSIREKRKLR
ncbi:nitrous oxide-stimulated promoter family protein [Lachnoclostridium sp. An181]|uniref:nitrous oxide-stimulated promoter family protein n=1 Tax=Lachnoclostridium sp. An181 TaxID=1965575 RepID=UPI000B3A3CD0|nr:nitrous oxide-stimulated promoter family protein [Lachnoclostridium sp. An181]OUP50359.1 hypothetical protein B5F18_04045 [Lachnoclostridium sp. An181]